MSILDLDNSLDLELYYTTRIIEFFKKNGPNGWGFSSYLTDPIVINTRPLFKIHQLPDILEAPKNYALYTFSRGSIYFLQILEAGSAFEKEWNRIQMKKKWQCGSTEIFYNDMSYIL